MAVETLYRSSHDTMTTFPTRAEAQAHDDKMECCYALADLFRHVLPDMSEEDAESLGLFLAVQRTEVASALKKDPAALRNLIKVEESRASSVVPLAQAV